MSWLLLHVHRHTIRGLHCCIACPCRERHSHGWPRVLRCRLGCDAVSGVAKARLEVQRRTIGACTHNVRSQRVANVYIQGYIAKQRQVACILCKVTQVVSCRTGGGGVHILNAERQQQLLHLILR